MMNNTRNSIEQAFPTCETKPKAKLAHKQVKAWLRKILITIAVLLVFNSAFIHFKAYAAQYLLKQAWQETKVDKNVKPWPWADTWPVLKLGFPSVDEKQIVLAGDSGNALAFAPGVSYASVAPGQEGTVVISGHRDTHFSILQHLNPTEEIVIEDSEGNLFTYEIINIEVIDINEQQITQTDFERLLLVTCYPFEQTQSQTPLRYIIEALPVKSSKNYQYLAQESHNVFNQGVTFNF
ncbi:class GN sortase [Thalassomonas sp. M1454]|uniref:class GN sortase n=1 Tax=Thalassomonas sp. M1454 TaxID=2594477 RepID=UPI00117C4994|nr:class GN sortase [Thalassomonas sp. M1454]TRX53845.1 class GN sortase [Thalassomonas sp. M1454]